MSITSSETEPAIALTDVHYVWPGTRAPTFVIPRLHLAVGARVFLYGPSGSGKSTLLNLLAGIANPRAGSVKILGQDLGRMSVFRRDRFRARHVGVIFQQFNLIPYLTVRDNVHLARHFAHASSRDERAEAEALLRQLGLPAGLLARKATELSVGQQQRVAVARALINKPELILADEPTSALDSDARDNFIELMMAAADQYPTTIVFVSHDAGLRKFFHQQLDVRDIFLAGGD